MSYNAHNNSLRCTQSRVSIVLRLKNSDFGNKYLLSLYHLPGTVPCSRNEIEGRYKYMPSDLIMNKQVIIQQSMGLSIIEVVQVTEVVPTKLTLT
jgi:hypothetical protein